MFLGSASKPRSMVCQWFGLKTTMTVSPGFALKPEATVSPGLASKPVAMVFVVWSQNHLVSKPLALVFWFGPQNWHMRFSDLAHKITMAVSSFGPQNHVGYGLSVAPQNRRDDEDGAGHTWGSSGLLHLEESQTRVFQFCLKTEGVTAGDECGINAEVAWK
jgi:hypothetical protein